MRKMMAYVAIAGLLLAGCAKKEAPAAAQNQTVARKMLIEGTVFLKQGDIKNAVGSFAGAIKAAPEDFEGYFMLSETFVHLKQYPQAISVLSTAVRQFPENGLAYFLLAVAYESAEQPVPAIVAARRSVEIFTAKGDQDGVKRSTILLAALVQSAKQQSEDAATANAAKDAAKAAVSMPVPEAVEGGQPAVPAVK